MIVIFGNPCTMQVIIQHWDQVSLKSPSKHSNAPIIEKLTGIKKYDAHSEQREMMMNLIDKENYATMLERVEKMPSDDSIIGSSNFDVFMKCLSRNDFKWIDEINKAIEM